jgi:hypothetical protein
LKRANIRRINQPYSKRLKCTALTDLRQTKRRDRREALNQLVLLLLTDIVPSQSCRTTRNTLLQPKAFFMSAFEARGNRIDRFRYMTKTPAFLQFRNSAVVLIDIVIASDCQYYFCAGSAKFPNLQIVCNLRV